MRKTLRIIAVSAGLVSAVATAILAFIYLEDAVVNVKKIVDRVKTNNGIGDEFDDAE